jgi:thiol-disulfide isomerase/thioredoxin
MKQSLACLVLSTVLALPLSAQEGKEAPKQDPAKQEAPAKLQLGARVNGAVTLTDLDGKVVKAQEQMGKLTVINFWSTQCPVQKAFDGRLAEIQKEFEGQGVTFLHIDSNQGEIEVSADNDKPAEKIRAHLKENKLPFRVLLDNGNKVADMFDAKTTPHIYVFGKDGRLCYRGLVDDDTKNNNAEKRKNHLRDVLGKLVKGEKFEPFATTETGCSIKRVPPAKAAEASGDKDKKGSGN